MSEQCDQELCPFWTGEGCACAVFGIDEEEREQQRDRIEGLR